MTDSGAHILDSLSHQNAGNVYLPTAQNCFYPRTASSQLYQSGWINPHQPDASTTLQSETVQSELVSMDRSSVVFGEERTANWKQYSWNNRPTNQYAEMGNRFSLTGNQANIKNPYGLAGNQASLTSGNQYAFIGNHTSLSSGSQNLLTGNHAGLTSGSRCNVIGMSYGVPGLDDSQSSVLQNAMQVIFF